MDDIHGEKQSFRAENSVDNIVKCESGFFYDGRTDINVLKKIEILGPDENWYPYPSIMKVSKKNKEYSACIVYNRRGDPVMYKTEDFSDLILLQNASENGIDIYSLYE